MHTGTHLDAIATQTSSAEVVMGTHPHWAEGWIADRNGSTTSATAEVWKRAAWFPATPRGRDATGEPARITDAAGGLARFGYFGSGLAVRTAPAGTVHLA